MTAAGGFNRTFAVVLAILVALVTVFGVLTSLQGPKLSDAVIDSEAVVLAGGQQLRLFTNQPVATVLPEQVTIVPGAPFSVLSQGSTISVQFAQPLRYDTDYRVEIAGVTGPAAAQASIITYEFRTSRADIHYLDRGDTVDEIVRTSLAATEREVIHSAPRIQDYALFEQALVVVTLDDDDFSQLSLVSPDGKIENLSLPGAGTITSIAADRPSGTLGFVFSAAADDPDSRPSPVLYTVQLAGNRQLEPVNGLDGEPLEVTEWNFVPGGTSLVAHATDLSLLMVDVASGIAVPLGQFSEVGAISADGSRLVVGDPFGPLALTIADASSERLNPSPLDGELTYGGELRLLHGGSRVQKVAMLDGLTGRFSSHLVVDDGRTAREIFRTVRDEGSIERFSLSPNDQYVAVEVVPNVSNSVLDGYAANPRSTSITTFVIDLDAGAVVRSFEGFAVSW